MESKFSLWKIYILSGTTGSYFNNSFVEHFFVWYVDGFG